MPTTVLTFNYLWITDYLVLVFTGQLKSSNVATLQFIKKIQVTANTHTHIHTHTHTHTGEVKSYPEIAAFTLGPSFSTLVHTATAVSCLGGCVGTLIFLGTHARTHARMYACIVLEFLG